MPDKVNLIFRKGLPQVNFVRFVFVRFFNCFCCCLPIGSFEGSPLERLVRILLSPEKFSHTRTSVGDCFLYQIRYPIIVFRHFENIESADCYSKLRYRCVRALPIISGVLMIRSSYTLTIVMITLLEVFPALWQRWRLPKLSYSITYQ